LEVERVRQLLTAEFVVLNALPKPHILQEMVTNKNVDDLDSAAFDDLDDDQLENMPLHTEHGSATERLHNDNDILPPERRQLVFPSNLLPDGHPLRQLELNLRIKQATRYLAALREAVADKSFQYSHIMRSAPSNAVRTRSRTVIAKLNERISLCCRIYSRTRAAMVRLGADDKTLNSFRILLKEDVKASTAMLKPNVPGSSSLRLSWIWQTQTGGPHCSVESMTECMCSFLRLTLSPLKSLPVQRVHWLRARAQKNRWQEEFTLVKYEMEWTSRFFLYRAEEWMRLFNANDKFPLAGSDGNNMRVHLAGQLPHADSDGNNKRVYLAGPRAYAARQAAQWRQLALDAEVLFLSVNKDYVRRVM
jgi:hypothetical protein